MTTLRTDTTLKTFALLIALLAIPASTNAQAAPGGIEPAAKPDATKKIEATILVDFAWKPELLPLTNEDLTGFTNRLGGDHSNIQVRIGMLYPTTRPAGLGEDWQMARLTIRYSQIMRPGLEGELRCRSQRRQMQEHVKRQLSGWLDSLDNSMDQTRKRTDELHETIRNADLELKRLGADDELKRIDRQLRELTIEQYAKQAREREIGRQMSAIAQQARDKQARDPVLKELREIAGIRQEALRMALKAMEKGAESQAKVRDAQVKALEARVKIAQREEAVADAVGGELLTRLTSDRVMLAIDLGEMSARSLRLSQMRAQLQKAKDQLVMRIRDAKKAIENAKPWRIVATPQPTVKPVEPE